MKVKELKELLEGLPEDSKIYFRDEETYCLYTIDEVAASAGKYGMEYILWGIVKQ